MNESFGSTTAEDALFLGSEILRRITDLDLLGVYVTFIDELASLNEACVSGRAPADQLRARPLPADIPRRARSRRGRPAGGHVITRATGKAGGVGERKAATRRVAGRRTPKRQ
jgi:DNA mismatch repair protein MutS